MVNDIETGCSKVGVLTTTLRSSKQSRQKSNIFFVLLVMTFFHKTGAFGNKIVFGVRILK